jgi:hypothetical protein
MMHKELWPDRGFPEVDQKGGAVKHSRRARILAEVLEYINNDDWDERAEFLVFGKEAFEIYTGEVIGQDTRFEDSLRKLVTKVKVNQGDRAVAKRISLEAIPKDSTQEDLLAWFSQLPRELQAQLAALSRKSEPSSSVKSRDADADALDAALASAAIRDLDAKLARITTLDEVDLGPASIRGAEYFEEAHRCDLYGLRIASAVLCRAMLEAALIQIIDPRGLIESDPHRKKKSYIGSRLMKRRNCI